MINIDPPIGKYAPDFELPDTHGSVHHLTRYLEKWQAIVVVIMCNHCPDVQACVDELKTLQTEFAPQKLTVIGINANDDKQVPEDGYKQMKVFAQAQALNFPYLRDVTQDVARTFGAEKTPQAFLLDATGKICYAGAVCKTAGSSSSSKSALREAIAQLLAGKSITVPVTDAPGCSIKWRKPLT